MRFSIETKKELTKANERLSEITAKLQQELIDLNKNKTIITTYKKVNKNILLLK